MKHTDHTLRSWSPATALLITALISACSGGGGGASVPGGGGGGGGGSTGNEAEIGTVYSSAAASPAYGGLLRISGTDDIELDGVFLEVPPQSLAQSVTLNIGTPKELPADSPLGEVPVGKAFVIEPSGTTFAAGKPATLTLPVPPGDAEQDLHIGRWNPAGEYWENLGGVRQGDFISTDVDHLSLYALLYSGKSRVRVINGSANKIEIRHIAGPAPPEDMDPAHPFPAYRPLPKEGLQIESGLVKTLSLLPGTYHFVVSYPTPQPGVANSLFFTIPKLLEGADDPGIDQRITITRQGATSDDPFTQASIQFAGANQVEGTNMRPIVRVSAEGPANVAIVDAETGGAVTNTTRVIDMGDVKVEQFVKGTVKLSGTPTDPEGHSPLRISWTWSFGSLPNHYTLPNGATDTRDFFPHPIREGTYTVYFTAYDQFGLFDEGRWNITVVPNQKPTIEVVVDDTTVDFGRLDDKRRNMGALPVSGPVAGVADFIDTDGDGIVDTTRLKTLPVSPGPMNPDQDPTSMAIVFAIVADPDGDPLSGGFILPEPIFGDGTVYAAITVPPTLDLPWGLAIGDMIDTYAEMDAYNAELLLQASLGNLPPDPVIFPNAPAGAQVLPIIWEAPDDPDVPQTTNDCSEFAECMSPNGGVIAVGARITDGFSMEKRDFAVVGYPDDATGNFQLQAVVPNPADPAPGQGVQVLATIFPPQPGIDVTFVIAGSDGYGNEETNKTDDSGVATFYIPGGAEGVSDHVVVTCGGSKVEVNYVF